MNVDSLVSAQIATFVSDKVELAKHVQIGDSTEETRFIPDSEQWSNELDIFRQINQINKPVYKNEVNEQRDSKSNLTVREVKALEESQVTSVKFFFLGTIGDIRKIEATLREQNPLYSNERRLVLEFEKKRIHRYRIEGYQKMALDDTVKFIVAGELAD